MLDLHSAIYVWKGRGATLDARNVGLQLGVLALYLLHWYDSTNTDAECVASARPVEFARAAAGRRGALRAAHVSCGESLPQ